MLAKEGSYLIYRVQYLDLAGGWKDIDLRQGWSIPRDEQYDELALLKEPFLSFSPAGRCWQETGILGAYVREMAEDLCLHLVKHNPGRRFRVVSLQLTQAVVVVHGRADHKVLEDGMAEPPTLQASLPLLETQKVC